MLQEHLAYVSVVTRTLNWLLLQWDGTLREGRDHLCVGLPSSGLNTVPSTGKVLLWYLWNDWMCKLDFCCVSAIWQDCLSLHFPRSSPSRRSNSSTVYFWTASLIFNVSDNISAWTLAQYLLSLLLLWVLSFSLINFYLSVSIQHVFSTRL